MADVQTRTVGIRDVGIKNTSRGDLFQVTTTDGTEYSTFNAGMGHQARQLIGRTVLLRFTEKQVGKDGRWYTNRYYEGAEPVEGASTNGATESGASTGDQRETRIMRQTASKVAAHMLGYLPDAERTSAGLLTLAEFLVAYYRDGYDPSPSFASVASAAAYPHTDDDIPF